MNGLTQLIESAWWPWMVAASWQVALMVVLVGAASLAARRLSARLRYLLWLLVLVKMFTPPSLGARWGVGHWAVRPAWEWTRTQAAALAPETPRENERASLTIPAEAQQTPGADADSTSRLDRAEYDHKPSGLPLTTWLWLAWAAGAAGLLGWVLLRYAWMARLLRGAESVESGPVHAALERLARRLGAKSPPALLVSDRVASPFLMGVLRPRIVLPAGLAGQLAPDQLEAVLLHELMHWRRRDLLVGWLQVLGQGLFWFHPLVWLAGAQLRHERECACDEAVLATGCAQPGGYGRSLLQVLLAAGGRSSAVLGFLGIFERNTRLQRRLEEIMNQEEKKKRPGAWGWMLVLLFTVVCLPMAPVTVRSQPAEATTKTDGLRQRYFVLLVVGEKGEMTFQGEPATFDTLPSQFQKVPNRPHTVLEITGASKAVPQATLDAVWKKAYKWEKDYHFEYLSKIEEHPLGAKAREPVTGFEHPERKYVRVVLDTQGNMTFEGRKTTLEELPALIGALPEPKNTALAVAVTASSIVDTPQTKKMEDEILGLGAKAGLGFLGTIGAHPAGSYGVRDTTLYNGHLVRPAAVDIEESPGGGPLTVDAAVAAICKAAGLPYQREKSAGMVGPALKELTAPLHVKNTMPEKMLLDVLGPVGLRFDLDGYGLFLYRPAPAAVQVRQAEGATVQKAAQSKAMLNEIENLLESAGKLKAEIYTLEEYKARGKEYSDLLNQFYEKNYDAVLVEAPGLKARVLELVRATRRKADAAKSPEERQAQTAISNISTALERYEIDTGNYPTTAQGLRALLEPPDNVQGWHGPYINRLLEKDPWGHAYRYASPGKNGAVIELASAGPDGRFDTADDITNTSAAPIPKKTSTAAPKDKNQFNLTIKTYEELVADQVAFHVRNKTFSEQEVREYFKKQADGVQKNYGGRVFAYGYMEQRPDGEVGMVWAPVNGGKIEPARSGPADHLTFYDDQGNLLVTSTNPGSYQTQLIGGEGSNVPRIDPAWPRGSFRGFYFVFSVDPNRKK